MVSPAEDNAPDKSICNTLLGVYLKFGLDGYFGSKYWHDGNRIVKEKFDRGM